MKEESWDTWHGGWNSHPEPQRLPQSSNQQIFLEWEASEGRATVTDRVYVWPGWLTLINRILNELYNDLMFFIGVLINSARSSQCHPLVPGSEQLQLTCLICHWTSYILVLSAPSWLYTFFKPHFLSIPAGLFVLNRHSFPHISSAPEATLPQEWGQKRPPLILTLHKEKHYLKC